jgi:Flp pilus assembly protein TadG
MRSLVPVSRRPLCQRSRRFTYSLVRVRCRQMWRDQCGATAIEFALIASVLVLLLLNGVDLGRYIYYRDQVENATQAGAHAVWERCDPTKLPIVPNCYTDQTTAENAVASVVADIVPGVTGDHVTLAQGYYCPDATGTLHAVTNVATPPSQCLSGVVPGIYARVEVTYSFAPLFGNLTVVSMFGTPTSTTSYMRL